MKKNNLLVLSLLVIMILWACSKDNAEPAYEQACLITKIINVDIVKGNDTSIVEYNDLRKPVKYYNKKMTSNTILEYSDNELSKQIDYDNNKELYRISYIWKKDTLIKINEQKNIDDIWKFNVKEVFVLNANKLAIKHQTFIYYNETWDELSTYKTYDWNNGNIQTTTVWENAPDSQSKEKAIFIYEYDDKNNPVKNFGFMMPPLLQSKNNILKETKQTNADYLGLTTRTILRTHTYEYNANNFPTKVTMKSNEPTVTYYEYNCK